MLRIRFSCRVSVGASNSQRWAAAVLQSLIASGALSNPPWRQRLPGAFVFSWPSADSVQRW